MDVEHIIKNLFSFSKDIRYVAIYYNNELQFKQRETAKNSSSNKTDEFEELLVNPTLLKLTTQRGNIDCGGLNYLIVGYGNFFQLIKSIKDGHVSICIDKNADLNKLPTSIFNFIEKEYSIF